MYPRLRLEILNPTPIDVSDYLLSHSLDRGDVSQVGASGVDGIVSFLSFALGNSGQYQCQWDSEAVVDSEAVLDSEKTFDSEDDVCLLLAYLFQAEPTLARDSFSPRDSGSKFNNPTPLLYPNREVVFYVDGVERWRGYIREIKPGRSKVDVVAYDPAKLLQDAYIYTSKEYGSEAGVPAETVIQQIIDDSFPTLSASDTIIAEAYTDYSLSHRWLTTYTVKRPTESSAMTDIANIDLGAGIISFHNSGTYIVEYTYRDAFYALHTPVSPSFLVTPYKVEYESVWDAIQKVASMIGWYLGYRYIDGQFRLTFLEPPRLKNTPDFTLDADKEIYTQDLAISDVDVRNFVKVTYRDKVSKTRKFVTVQDNDSIAQFGKRSMEIEEADTSLIDTEEEALRLANAVLHDLSSLPATTRVNLPYMPQIDTFSTVAIRNPLISSTIDFYAVESVRHYGEPTRLRTEIVCSGKVIGGRSVWLQKETRKGRPAEPIRGGEIVPGAVDKDRLRDGVVDNSKLSDGSVDANKIVDGAINTDKIGDNAINSGKISDGAIDTNKLSDGATTTAKIAKGAVGASEIYLLNDTAGSSTTSKEWVDIPGFELNFTLADEATVLILCRISAYLNAMGGLSCKGFYRLLVDGEPRRTQAIQDTNTGTFWVPVILTDLLILSAGQHTIKGQMRCDTEFSNTVYAYFREILSLIIKR